MCHADRHRLGNCPLRCRTSGEGDKEKKKGQRKKNKSLINRGPPSQRYNKNPYVRVYVYTHTAYTHSGVDINLTSTKGPPPVFDLTLAGAINSTTGRATSLLNASSRRGSQWTTPHAAIKQKKNKLIDVDKRPVKSALRYTREACIISARSSRFFRISLDNAYSRVSNRNPCNPGNG